MRIISGLLKGRNILIPGGIRPTQNKVRKAIFDILGDIAGLTFLEIFAGSGAVGFEALSKGADRVIFIEKNHLCGETIKRNISLLKAASCEVLSLDAQKAILLLHKRKEYFDVIFLDPPYYQDLGKKTLQTLGAYDILAPCGFIIIQSFRKERLPKETEKFVLVKEARYGDTVLALYNKR